MISAPASASSSSGAPGTQMSSQIVRPTLMLIWCREILRRGCIDARLPVRTVAEPRLGEGVQAAVAAGGRGEHPAPGQRDDALRVRAVLDEHGLAGAGERGVERPGDVL